MDSPYTTRTAKYKIPFLPLGNEHYSCYHSTPALLPSTTTPIETPRSSTAYPTASYHQVYPAPVALQHQICPYQHFHPCHGGYLCESIYPVSPATTTRAAAPAIAGKSSIESINRYETPRTTVQQPQTTKEDDTMTIDKDLDKKIKSALEREIEIDLSGKSKDIDDNIYKRKSDWMAPEKLPPIHKLSFQDIDNDADRSSVSITNTTDSIDKDNLTLKKLGSLFNGEIKASSSAMDLQDSPSRYLYEESEGKDEETPSYLSKNYYDESLGIGAIDDYGENSNSNLVSNSINKENDDGEDVDSLKYQKKEKIDIENIETAIYGERLNPDNVDDTTTNVGNDILLEQDDTFGEIQSKTDEIPLEMEKPLEVEETNILSAPSLVNSSLGDVKLSENVVEETAEPSAEPQTTEEYNYQNYETTEGAEYDYSNYDPSQYPTDYDPSTYGYTYDEQTGQYLDENQQPYDPNAVQQQYDPNALQQQYDTSAEGAQDYNYEGYDTQYAEQPAVEEVPVEPEPEISSPKSILSPEKVGDTNSLKKKKKVNFLESETDESSSAAVKSEQPISNESDFDFSATN